MKILVFGSDGFIGKNVCLELEKDNDVVRASRSGAENNKNARVDLLSRDSINKALNDVHPEIIINCAGVVDSTMNLDLNCQFTENIFEEAIKTDCVKKLIICGSAGEYGLVDLANIPVDEATPLNANFGYGLAKLKEEKLALNYQKDSNIKVVVLRIFNPIGKGMANKFLLTRLLQQINEYKLGSRASIEISRLDSKRDYIAIKDVARAFKAVAEGNPIESVYNVGSGHSTSNGELLELILNNSKLDNRPQIIETSDKAEALVAVQANINRISNEFNWQPVQNIEETIEEIVNNER